ncbi:MAG: 2-hydroxychromene-2-carboxylate isomerase [Limisphaerales bacterium]|jgi:2-hydroxychromene-2-carboxylate isomerase
MTKTVDFFWDIGSTNTYFAFHLLRPLAKKYDARINYVPFNLGYVFRHHNYALTDEPAAKMKNRKIDLMRWATRYGLDFQVPREFPIKTSRVLRASLVMREHGLEEAFMETMFKRYWEQADASIQTFEGMASSVAELGVDVDVFLARVDAAEMQELFIQNTQQALDEGIFGAPTMRIENEIYWGKDRFEFIEDHLAGA